MSADFIKMVSEMHNERFLVQIQTLARNKIPCGFFTGFSVPNNTFKAIDDLKNVGINLTCICTVNATQIGGGATIRHL